jgi:hypothetical protein
VACVPPLMWPASAGLSEEKELIPVRSVFSPPARMLPAVVACTALCLPFVASAFPAATASVAAAGKDSAPARLPQSARVPHYSHIAVIIDTSHDYSSLLHNRHAPVINRLAREYGLASRYYTTSDPGTANIMALLAGNPFGVADSVPYWDQQLHKSSLLSQLTGAHLSWKEYAQGLPYPGYLGSCYPTRCVADGLAL